VGGVGRQQDLLLEPEVRLLFVFPVSEERSRRLVRGLLGSLAQPPSDHERVVVIP
jgi:hypothetical protein